MASTVCAAAEPVPARVLRLVCVGISVAASFLLTTVAAIDIFFAAGVAHSAADLLLVAATVALLVCCVCSLRYAARLRMPALLVSLLCFTALAFSGPGRSTSGFTFTTPSVTRYLDGAVLMALLLGIAMLTTQVAGKLAQRHACACE